MNTAGERTRRALIASASEIIATSGWAAATTRRVADACGVNPALVHYHFGSTEDLRRQAAAVAATGAFGGPIRDMTAQADAAAGIRALVDGLDALDPLAPRQVLLFEAALRAARDPALREQTSGLFAGARQEVQAWIAHAAPDVDPVSASEMIVCLVDGVLLHRAVDPAFRARSVLPALFRAVCP